MTEVMQVAIPHMKDEMGKVKKYQKESKESVRNLEEKQESAKVIHPQGRSDAHF